jgi:glycosyltransferase involved in cell wall biosynthesis
MTTDTVGGVWTFTIELARALQARDIEVWLAALGGLPTPGQRREAGAIPGLRLFKSRYKLEWMDDPWNDVTASGEWLLKLAGQCRPDVIHLNSFGHGVLPWQAPVVLTAHSCVASWWQAAKGEQAPREWDRYRQETVRSLKAAHAVTTPSHAMAAALQQHHGVRQESIRVIPNARCRSLFRIGPKREAIFAAGRLWDEGKNISQLAGVARDLPWPVYLGGAASSPNGHGRKLEGCYRLGLLSQPQMAQWYAQASIYVLPARYEPFGLSALEAALSGCALVLGDIPSLREVWGDAAIFVAPDDSRDLKDALYHLTCHSADRQQLADRALARAQAFTPPRMASAYLDVYKQASNGRFACES